MSQRPNVNVIYQDAPQQPIGCLAVVLEALTFLAFVVIIGLFLSF